MPIRTVLVDELLAMSLQSAEGTEATPVTADIFPIISAALDPHAADIERADKGFGRSFFGYVRGGDQRATWEATLHLLLAAAATPVVAPSIEQVLRGAMGASIVSINTTVQAAPAPTATTFTVGTGVGATLKVGDMLSVNIAGTFQMRPISAIATDALTFSPGFTAAPASAAVVKARLYRLQPAPNFYTLTNWLRDPTLVNTAYSRKAIDAVVGSLEIDVNQAAIRLTARGPASQVVRTSIAAIPTLPAFADLAQARNFGGVWVDATQIQAYDLQLTVENGAAELPVPFGKQIGDGVIFGPRRVHFNLTLDGNDGNATYLTDSENKTNRAFFAHAGDGEGKLFGLNMPKVNFALGEYEKGSETLRIRFNNSVALASAVDNELFLAVG